MLRIFWSLKLYHLNLLCLQTCPWQRETVSLIAKQRTIIYKKEINFSNSKLRELVPHKSEEGTRNHKWKKCIHMSLSMHFWPDVELIKLKSGNLLVALVPFYIVTFHISSTDIPDCSTHLGRTSHVALKQYFTVQMTALVGKYAYPTMPSLFLIKCGSRKVSNLVNSRVYLQLTTKMLDASESTLNFVSRWVDRNSRTPSMRVTL